MATQGTLAMRPVEPSIQPATSVQPAELALYSSLAALVPAPAQNTFIPRGCHRCSARVLKYPSEVPSFAADHRFPPERGKSKTSLILRIIIS